VHSASLVKVLQTLPYNFGGSSTLDELQFLRLYTDCYRSLRIYSTEAWRLFEILDPSRATASFSQQQLELTRQWDLEISAHKAYLRCRTNLLQAAGVLPSKK
jgi:hypothetical protein